MMPAFMFKQFNNYRKDRYFGDPIFKTRKKYAFVGVGLHSLTNFYPLLRHFNIAVKYICTKNSDWSAELSPLFPAAIFTHTLSDILGDSEITGVFVSADPSAHQQLVGSLLRAGKHVFVEKPPCAGLEGLQDLLSLESDSICKVGLQRRYWPGNKTLFRKKASATHYTYQFSTGPYPAGGDVFTELFLHPLDYCHFLFGDCTLHSFSRRKDGTGITLQMHVGHPGGITGLLQLSTDGSWAAPVEQLVLSCKEESLFIEYPALVKGLQKPKRILGIPAERVWQQPAVTKEYFSGIPTLVPAAEMNSLVVYGFYEELANFISLVEKNDKKTGAAAGKNGYSIINAARNDLPGLLPVYRLIEQLRSGPSL